MTGIKLYGKDFYSFGEDEKLVSEYLTRIISTSPGEVINKPAFGSKVKSYLFNYSDYIKQDIERELNNIFSYYLPGYSMKDFAISEEEYCLTIELGIIKNDTNEIIEYKQSFTLLEKIV